MNSEDIKVLEKFINNYKQIQEKYKDDEIQAEIERSCYFEEVPAQAIENLIKRNKELEKINFKVNYNLLELAEKIGNKIIELEEDATIDEILEKLLKGE